MCAELRDCVECQAFQSGPEQPTNCSQCPLPVRTVEEEEALALGLTDTCTAANTAGCSYTFSVGWRQDGELWLVVHSRDGQPSEICPPLGAYVGVGAGVLVLLIGLLSILFFKCYIVIDDRRQYAQFQKDVDMMKSSVNQNASELYKSPITRFENPMFGK